MTEGYPPQWQNDVRADETAGQFGDGRHEVGTAHNDGASAVDVPLAPSYTDAGLSTNVAGGSDQSKADAAKEQASAVKEGAAQAGQQVASVAKDEAHNVVAEAGAQTKDLLNQARSELTEQAGTQQQRLAQGLRALGDELEAMTHHSESAGVATDLAKQAATRSHDAASWLDSREPGSLISELQSFARQRPAAFIALAAGAGLVAGRLGRGVKDATGDNSASSPSNPATDVTKTAPSTYVSSPSSVTDPGAVSTDESRPFASSQDSGYPSFSNESGR